MTYPELEQLRDIHLPPPPLLAAVQEAWWLVALALAVLAAGGWGLGRFLRRRRLRAALGEVSRLADAYARDGDASRLAAGLSLLLRRYATARYPGAAAAGLTGVAWLAFLDDHGGEGGFSSGVGTALISLPYRSGGEADGDALIALVRRWLEANPS